MRLLGNIEAKTDVKGRAFLPAVFRKVLQASGSESLVLRKDIFQSCLVLYPESVWNEQMDMLRARLNRYNAQHQRIFRQFVSEVEAVTLDEGALCGVGVRRLEIVQAIGLVVDQNPLAVFFEFEHRTFRMKFFAPLQKVKKSLRILHNISFVKLI